MNKTWFTQLIAAFVLAALAGLYLVPQTLSAEEMSQIVGACGRCSDNSEEHCTAVKEKDRENCEGATYVKAIEGDGQYQLSVEMIRCKFTYIECTPVKARRCKIPEDRS